MTINVQAFDLRYNDRVLAFHAYINTDREPDPIALEIVRASRGRRLDANLAWLEGWNNGWTVWDKLCLDNEVASPELQYGGRILAAHVYVNTDRDPYHIHKAILRVARGPRLDACLVRSELYEGEDGRKVWAEIQRTAVMVSADPRAVPFDASPTPGVDTRSETR